ncbi:hypothetical protein O1Q79_00407 [Lonepinella sp. MS14434]|uniref:hypothetical protein n=3 Tax=unclassified Lonepinella TaxID=2642006 RepID=UPI0036DF881B
METPKYLPKKAYSLDDAVKYISSNHNIEISKKDLLEYFQNGDIQLSVHLSGNTNEIRTINRKKVDRKNPLLIDINSVFIKINTKMVKSKTLFSDDNLIELDIGDFKILLRLNQESSIYNDVKNLSYIELYNEKLNCLHSFSFNSYFPLGISFLNEHNIDQVLEVGYINDFNHVKKTEISFLFSAGKNKAKIHLDDICILHRDLVEFLEMFSIIDRKYNQIEEISSLKEKVKELSETIAEKDNQIAKLKSQLAEENRPILLGEHRKDDLLKIAIEVRKKYWSNYPENIKSNIQIRDYIKRDYGIATTTAEEIEKIACPINRTKNKK